MSLSGKVIALVDALDDFKAKLVAKINSKRASAVNAANANTVENKTAAQLTSQINSIYQSHLQNTNNPHNLTPAIVGAMSQAEINALEEQYLTKNAGTLDFIGHPSIQGLPLASTMAPVASALRYCRLEKQPGDVLVAHMLNGGGSFGDQLYSQIKCPIANSGDFLRPLAYATKHPQGHAYFGFGNGLVFQRNPTLVNTGTNGFITRSTDRPYPNSAMALVAPTTFQGSTGSNFNPRSDIVYYAYNNRVGCFYANLMANNFSTEEMIYPIADIKTHEDAAYGQLTNHTSTYSNNLGTPSFGGNITDYCTFVGTTPNVATVNHDSFNYRRDLVCFETATHICVTVYTRALFTFGTYKRDLVTFYMREEYRRPKSAIDEGFTKVYTSPKFNIDYPSAMINSTMVYDDTGGLAPFLVLENTVRCRTSFCRGKYFLYGYTYSADGTQIGGKFWKVRILGDNSYDFSVARETLFEGSWESMALLGNACYIGKSADERLNFIGRTVHGKAATLRVLQDTPTFSVTTPYLNGGTFSNIPYTSSSIILPMIQEGSSYKLVGYSDDVETTAYAATRWLWGVNGFDDTLGHATVSPGTSYATGTNFSKALQTQLATACKALITEVTAFDDIILDIIIPQVNGMPGFAIAYPYYLESNAQLTGQNMINAIVFSFVTNTKSGTIASFSDVTKVVAYSRNMSRGVSPNTQLEKLWRNNTLIAPFVITCYDKQVAAKYRVAFDLLPVFCLSREGTVRTSPQIGVTFKFSLSNGTVVSPTISGSYVTDYAYAASRPLAEARLTATRLLGNMNSSGRLGYAFTDDLNNDPGATIQYIGPITEFNPIFSMQGHMPYGLGAHSGIWKSTDVFNQIASLNSLVTQFNQIGSSASATYRIIFAIDTVNGPASPKLTFPFIANDTAPRTAQQVALGTVSRTQSTFTYVGNDYPRVGIDSYLISDSPAARSIMTVPNQSV